MEDVHRAGGIMAILGELERAGLIHAHLPTVHSATPGDALNKGDIGRTTDPAVQQFFMAAPGGLPTQTAVRQYRRRDSLDLHREAGVIRSAPPPFRQPGCAAVLAANVARAGRQGETPRG